MNQADTYKIPLMSAVLININIMLGAGIFINTPSLATRTGALGGGLYLLIGFLMLPLILSMAQLVRIHPSGGVYTYGEKEIHPLVGFFSGWSYFIAKLASCMVMVHASVTLLQHIFPLLGQIHWFILDFVVISIFTVLNLLALKAGSAIQKMFIGFKMLPIGFAIGASFYLFQTENFSASNQLWEGIPSSLPLVVYAVIGFEAACSISNKIENPTRNAPLAILISFGAVIFIATVYQTLFYGALGQKLLSCTDHCLVFPTLIQDFFGQAAWTGKLEGIIHLAIASSTLGAAYGIIFSNGWNLHVLAQNGHVWFSKLFEKFNRNNIPFACVIAEGVIALSYLIASQGVLIPLQQISALGCVVTYTISVGALLRASKNSPEFKINSWLPICGLVSCSILILACVRSFFLNGASSLSVYIFLFVFGTCMFLATAKKQEALDYNKD